MITLEKLYNLQLKLDKYIIDKKFNNKQNTYKIDANDKSFLNNRIIALFTEVGEFTNATRCFKYWSEKPPESRMRLLDEYVDILHIYLSIGNTMGFTPLEVEEAYLSKNKVNFERQDEGY